MKRLLWLFAAFALVILLGAGCGGGGGAELDESLVGVWMPVYMAVEGVVMPVYVGLNFPVGATHTTLEFNDDGSATQTFLDESEAVVEAVDGTWSADELEGWMNFDGDIIEFTYTNNGNALDLIYEDAAEDEVLMRLLRIIELSEHDSDIARAWKVTDARVNDVAMPVTTLLGSPPGTDTTILQPVANGTGYYRELDGHTILRYGVGQWWCEDMELVVDGILDADGLPGKLRAICDGGGSKLTFLATTGDTVELWLEPYGWEDDPQDPDVCNWWYAVSCTRDAVAANLSDYFGWPPGTSIQSLVLFADGTATLDLYAPTWAGGQYGQFTADAGAATLNLNNVMNLTYTVVPNSTLVTTDTGREPGHTWVVNWLID